MQSKKIYIKGMHCASCKKIIKDEVEKIDGVKKVDVDVKEGFAVVKSKNGKIDADEIKNKIEQFGYTVSENSIHRKNDWVGWFKAIGIILIILFLYRIFQTTGIIDKLNFQSSQISFGVAFLVGLTASISSCMAVVGSVVIAFGEKYESQGKNFFQRSVRPNLLFHAGRLLVFFLLGGLLGLIGGEISISGQFVSWVTIFVAVVMAWLGLNILGLFPSISNLTGKFSGRWTEKWDRLKESEHKAAPLLLGGLSFFLPCGFTQSMQIFALASGSFWVGGLSLFLFALGTMPALLAVGIASFWTKNRNMETLKKVAGLIVIIFAVYTFNSGMALSGIKDDIFKSNPNDALSNKTENQKSVPSDSSKKEQVVKMEISGLGFSPDVIKIKAGVPVKWVIDGEQVSGCTNRIIVPFLDINKDIKYGENIIRFTPKKKGTINFSCWMGMVRGKFIVE